MPPSPVKRIEVRPSERKITAGDSIRLDVLALDAEGKPLPDAVLWVRLLGGNGEGMLRPETGYLVASNVGKFPLALSAVVPGIAAVRGHDVGRVRRGRRSGGAGGPGAEGGDHRDRPVPRADGASILEGQRPDARSPCLAIERPQDRHGGPNMASSPAWRRASAKLTASADGASGTIEVTGRLRHHRASSRSPPTSPRLARATWCRSPSRRATPPGKPIAGLTPTWSFSPGDGQLDADGRFVAYRPGVYTITATLGHRARQHDRHGGRARRAALGDRRRAASAHRVRDVGSVDPSRTARSPTSARTGRRPGVRHRHQRSRPTR